MINMVNLFNRRLAIVLLTLGGNFFLPSLARRPSFSPLRHHPIKGSINKGSSASAVVGAIPRGGGGPFDTELAQNLFIGSYGFNAAMCGLLPSCLLYTSPSPRDQRGSRMPSSA